MAGELTRRDPMEHTQRRYLYEIVKAEPGIAAAEVLKKTPFSWESLWYHARRLADGGFLVLEEAGDTHFQTRLYPGPKAPAGEATLQEPRSPRGLSLDILRRIAEKPGLDFSDLLQDLDTAPRNVHHHLKRLQEKGLLTTDGESRYRGLRATAEGLDALGMSTPPVPHGPPAPSLAARVLQAVRAAPSIPLDALQERLSVPPEELRLVLAHLAETGRVRLAELDGKTRAWATG